MGDNRGFLFSVLVDYCNRWEIYSLCNKMKKEDMLFTEATLKELNRRVQLVDSAITGLARAIDALQSMSLQFGVAETPRIAESILIGESEVQSLQSLAASIFNNKTVTVKEVREFLNFVMDLGKNVIEGEIYYSTQLAVNSYFPPEDIEHTQHDCITEYSNARIEYLEKEVKLLKDIIDLQRQEIEQLWKRKQTYHSVNEIINETEANEVPLDIASRQRPLEHPLSKLSNMHIEENVEVPGNTLSELCKINKTNNLNFDGRTHAFHTHSTKEGKDITLAIDEDKNIISHKKEISKPKGICSQTEDMLRLVSQEKEDDGSINLRLIQTTTALEIETEGCKPHLQVHQEEAKQLRIKKTVYAQVYNLPLFSARDTAEKMLLVVQRKLAFRNIELQVVKLRKPIDVDVSKPLLIYCEPVPFYPGMLRSVEMVLSRFNNVTTNIAVLFFHNKDELRIRKEIERMGSFDVGSLGDIIQIGHRMQDFQTNDASADSIVNFILTNGDMKSADDAS